jgi:hypothetical protein
MVLAQNGSSAISEEVQAFELAQRQAKALMTSNLIPEQFRNNLGNVLIALNMAKRLGADPLMVMQNLYIVHGHPGWSAVFMIATFNQSGKFSAIKYRFDGEGDDYGCTAYATELKSGEVIEGSKVTWAVVKGEGWSTKAGSKWKTMPDQMFRYRAATFFIRATAPEIAMGLKTKDELEDIGPDVQAPQSTEAAAGVAGLSARMGIAPAEESLPSVPVIDIEPEVQHVDAQIVESDEPQAEVELTAKHQVETAVYSLQKQFGVKAKDLEGFLPDGVKKFSDLSEEQAADVLPSVQQLLESKQAA